MEKITIFTSITDDKDEKADKNAIMAPSYNKFIDPRRNSRIQKIMPHLYFNTEYSIYLDGNIQLLKEPQFYIDKYLDGYDIAVYRHPVRDCLYDEALKCAQWGLDDPELIIEQAKAYEDDGFAKHKGLVECGVIYRHHTEKVKRFNETWWAHYSRYSRRDQISFMKAADEAGIRVNIINDFFVAGPDGTLKQSGELQIFNHKHKR